MDEREWREIVDRARRRTTADEQAERAEQVKAQGKLLEQQIRQEQEAKAKEQEEKQRERRNIDRIAAALEKLAGLDPKPEPVQAVTEPMSAADRRALWNEYREEVRKKKNLKITQEQMGVEARYPGRSEFAEWLSKDPIPNSSAHDRFMRILREKPHLK